MDHVSNAIFRHGLHIWYQNTTQQGAFNGLGDDEGQGHWSLKVKFPPKCVKSKQ